MTTSDRLMIALSFSIASILTTYQFQPKTILAMIGVAWMTHVIGTHFSPDPTPERRTRRTHR